MRYTIQSICYYLVFLQEYQASWVKKSHFVLPSLGQPQPTTATSTEFENIEKKPYIFAPGNETRNAVIPTEKLDEVFEDKINPDELEIEPDENEKDDKENETVDLEDENAELEQGAELASGMSIEEMTEAAKAIDNPTDEKAGILFKVEKTDMFEQLVSGDEERTARIDSIIDRYFRNLQPEVENEIEDSGSDDWKNFDIRNHLAVRKRKN